MHAWVGKLKRMRVGDALRRQPWLYAHAHRTLCELEQATLAKRSDWTRARYDEVSWSARRSPYGLAQARSGSKQWPLLRKAQVQAHPRAFRAQPGFMTLKSSTGGTSGAPLELYRSLQSIVFEQACLDLMMRKVGADPLNARCAVLRTDAVKDPNDFRPPFWVHAAGGRRLVFSSSHLSPRTLDHYISALETFGPDVMMGYPTSLEALSLLLEHANRCIHVPRVLSSSEVLHGRVWQAVLERLQCKLLDYYGQAERVAFAYALAPGEYRFLPGYAHVEFIEAEHGEESGWRTYEIVGTPLWNRAMPLVRYCTGDLIRLPAAWGAAELTELALGVRTFTGVLGRDGDILLTPEGGKVTGVSHFQRDVPHLMRIQVVQESLERVTILAQTTPMFDANDQSHLMENVRRKLPLSMHVEIRCVDRLERTALGKTPFVVHRPAVKQLLQALRVRGGAA